MKIYVVLFDTSILGLLSNGKNHFHGYFDQYYVNDYLTQLVTFKKTECIELIKSVFSTTHFLELDLG